MKSSGRNPFISQANLVLNLLTSKYVMKSAPETPLTKPSQYSGTVLPSGVRAPRPVTTTRFNGKFINIFWLQIVEKLLYVLFQVRNSLTNGGDGFSLFIRNRDVEFFFKFHNQLNGIQRVCSQIVGETCFRSNF